jgi:tRNA-specific 2-thiouridylase
MDGQARYVVGIDRAANTVTIGTADLLGVDEIVGMRALWCGPAPTGPSQLGAQVRAHGEEVPATVEPDSTRVRVLLDRRIRGVAPGQSVVLYDGTRVVGSATIETAGRARHTEPAS